MFAIGYVAATEISDSGNKKTLTPPESAGAAWRAFLLLMALESTFGRFRRTGGLVAADLSDFVGIYNYGDFGDVAVVNAEVDDANGFQAFVDDKS